MKPANMTRENIENSVVHLAKIVSDHPEPSKEFIDYIWDIQEGAQGTLCIPYYRVTSERSDYSTAIELWKEGRPSEEMLQLLSDRIDENASEA